MSEAHYKKADDIFYQRIRKHALESIAIQGFHLIHHFGRGNELSYTYSVGMNLRGHPEVIVFGLPQVVASHLLFDVCEEMKRGYAFELHEPNYGIVHNQVVYFKPVDVHISEQYMKHAYDILGKPCEAIQVFWPDPKNSYPWDVDSPQKKSQLRLFTDNAMS
jgi:hypothetical protein